MDEDIVVIHLGKRVTQSEYDAFVASIVAFLNQRYPNHNFSLPN